MTYRELHAYVDGRLALAGLVDITAGCRRPIRRHFELPGLTVKKDGKMFGYRLILRNAGARGGLGARIDIALVEWFAGKAHAIHEVSIRRVDDSDRREYLLDQMVGAYIGLAATTGWLKGI